MKKEKNVLKKVWCMAIIVTMFSISLFSPVSPIPHAESTQLPPIYVEKLVWDGSSYTDSVEVHEGDIVQFKVVIYNPYDYYEIHWSGIIYDQLPCNLEYLNESVTDLPLEYDHPSLDPEYYDIANNTVIWQIDRDSPILPHQYLNFTYEATAVCCGSNYLQNLITVHPEELVHICDPSDIILNDDGAYDVSDSASIKVICDEPSIKLTKQVKSNGAWMDSTTVYEGENVEFRLLIENNGMFNLTDIQVTDTLPSFLTYNYDANITPTTATDQEITWLISSLLIGESVEIVFTAFALEVGQGDNYCSVQACQGVSDSDTAHVMVSGMIVEKQVWSAYHQAWMDEIDVSVQDIVRFRITVHYVGNGTYTLYNIQIRDELPECLSYENNANPPETAISSDMKTIWWNFTINLPAGGTTTVEFDALVTETSGCGPCVNLANVSANECSGHYFMKEDTATVNAECPLTADAGGPYNGDINEQVFIEADATGGSTPYTYQWDLDDDGFFDDYTGKSLYYSWDEDGTYTITVKVTDDDFRDDSDVTTVTIYPPDNHEPGVPSKPSGETDGSVDEQYLYETSALDSDDDLIRYGWDWNGDGTIDEWTGYYASGSTASMGHTWTTSGIYQVKVKAQDEHGQTSNFSTSLRVTITDDSAPVQPLISGPNTGRINTVYSYAASTTDPDGDSIYYWFDWGDGTNSGWKGPYVSGQSVSETHTWTVQGSYTVKVKAKDMGGLESVWSSPIAVSMPKEGNPLMILWNTIIEWILSFFPHFSLFSFLF